MSGIKDGIKIILLGEAVVGKTNLILVATDKGFDPNGEASLTNTYCEYTIHVDNYSYKCFLWDTIGQEKYRALSKLYIKHSKIILIVFAINNRKSFQHVDFWYKNIKEEIGDDSYIVSLIKNKKDLFEAEDVVENDEIKEKAKELGVKFKVTSARTEAEVKNS